MLYAHVQLWKVQDGAPAYHADSAGRSQAEVQERGTGSAGEIQESVEQNYSVMYEI